MPKMIISYHVKSFQYLLAVKHLQWRAFFKSATILSAIMLALFFTLILLLCQDELTYYCFTTLC